MTEMVFADKMLHCWKRSNGFFISCAELLSKGLLSRSYLAAQSREQPANNFQFLLANEEVFLSTLPVQCHDNKMLVNLKLVRRMINTLTAQGMGGRKFRIKLWRHCCPKEEREMREPEGVSTTASTQEALPQQTGSASKVSIDSEVVDLVDDDGDGRGGGGGGGGGDVTCEESETEVGATQRAGERGAGSVSAPSRHTHAADSADARGNHQKPTDAHDADRATHTNLTRSHASQPTTGKDKETRINDSSDKDASKGIHLLSDYSILCPPDMPVKLFQRSCSCPYRKQGLFPSFSFLQCTYSTDSQFTILEHVGQAIVNEKLLFCFYKLKQVFFSVADLACSGDATLRVGKSCPDPTSDKTVQMSQEEQQVVSEFRGVSGMVSDKGDQLLSCSALLHLISRNQGNVAGSAIYLHQIGHICSRSDSIAHLAQERDSNMQYVQSAWMRAFQWHKEFRLQAARRRDRANSVTAAGDKATSRSGKPSAEHGDGATSPEAAEPGKGDGVVCARALFRSHSAQGTRLVVEEASEFTSVSPVSRQSVAVQQVPAVKQEPDWGHHQSPSAEQGRCVDDVKQEPDEGGAELGSARSTHSPQSLGPRHASVHLSFVDGDTVPTVRQNGESVTVKLVDPKNRLDGMSPLEGVVLDPACKKVKVVDDEEKLKRLLGDQSLLYHVLLTGVLTCSGCRYVCLSLDGQLYVNWGEVVEQLAEPKDRVIVFKQAQRLHAFLYQPPLYINKLLSHRYGSDLVNTLNNNPWVVVNTLVAVYNLGSGILDREKMLKRFVDVTPDSVCFPMFLMIKK